MIPSALEISLDIQTKSLIGGENRTQNLFKSNRIRLMLEVHQILFFLYRVSYVILLSIEGNGNQNRNCDGNQLKNIRN